MKTLEELKKTPRLVVGRVCEDGGIGEVHMLKWIGTVIWSYGGGWEHVSVSPYKRHIIPSWDDMCAIKNMFFHEDEVAVQYHPAKSEYVNIVENCLHLWKPTEQEMPVPNSLMVGLKKGQGMADVREFVKELEMNNTSTEHINKSIYCSSGWIPVEERLPENTGRYMTTNRIGGKLKTFDLWYENGIWLLDEEDDEFCGTVIAWCELPEPYKPEKGAQDGGDNEGNNKD